MAETKKQNRIFYLDVLKVLAIVLVLYNHSYWFINNNEHLLFKEISFTLCKIAVPLFFMVTGVLILKKDISYKEVFFKRIFRILIPLIVVTFVYMLYQGYGIKEMILSLFFERKDSPYWLWYLYALIGLYCLSPFLIKMIKNFKNKDFIMFIGIFVGLNGFIAMIPAILQFSLGHTLPFKFSLPLVINAGYLVMGYYLNSIKITPKINKISFATFIITFILSFIFLRQGYFKGMEFDACERYNFLTVAILSGSLFINIKYLCSKINIKKHSICIKIIEQFSLASFGVYLFHIFAITEILKYGILDGIFKFDSLVGTITMDLLIFIVLSLIVLIFRKVPIIKRFL